MATEPWRSLDATDRWQFREWFRIEMDFQDLKGVEKYHSDQPVPKFVGNPLQHAKEEALNLLFYLWMEERRQNDND